MRLVVLLTVNRTVGDSFLLSSSVRTAQITFSMTRKMPLTSKLHAIVSVGFTGIGALELTHFRVRF